MPGNLFSEWGMSRPPSTAPFMAAKTLAPVEVLARPTSRQARNAPGPSSLSSTAYMEPSTLVLPSYTGTPWETPSPESMTIPVVRPEAYRESTAWMATYMAGMLKVSNMIWVIFSLLALGVRGASVRRTGCSSQPQGQQGEDDPDHVRDLQHPRHVRRHSSCPVPLCFRTYHRHCSGLWRWRLSHRPHLRGLCSSPCHPQARPGWPRSHRLPDEDSHREGVQLHHHCRERDREGHQGEALLRRLGLRAGDGHCRLFQLPGEVL